MQEEQFKPGDKVMFKHSNNQVFIFVKMLDDDKATCVDTNNKVHEIYLVALEPYKFHSFF